MSDPMTNDPELARALEDARKVPTLAGGACLPWWRDGTVTQQHGLPGVVPALIDNSGRDVCEIDGAKDPAERQAQEEFVLFASHALPNIATQLLSQAAEVERLRSALDDECEVVDRLWRILASDPPPTYEQLGGRSIYDFATDAKAAESRAASLEGALRKARNAVASLGDVHSRELFTEICAVLSATKEG